MNKKEACEILGIKGNESEKEIKKAYKRAASKAHPDKEGGSDEAMKRVNEAKDFIDSGASDGPTFNGFRDAHRANAYGGMHDAYEDMMRQVNRGADVKRAINVPLELIAFGGKYKITVNGEELTVDVTAGVSEHTPNVFKGKGGKGNYRGSDDGDLHIHITAMPHPIFKRNGYDLFMQLPIDICTAILGGSKTIPTMYGKLKLTIPPCSESGRQLKIAGKGLPIPYANKFGNLICVIHIFLPTKDELSSDAKKHLEKFNKEVAYGEYSRHIDAKKNWEPFEANLSKYAKSS
jgi:curved DNA-binding protein